MSGRRVGPDSLDLQAGDTARIPTISEADRARIARRDHTARINLAARVRRRHLVDPDGPDGPAAQAELRELLDILGLLPERPGRRRRP